MFLRSSVHVGMHRGTRKTSTESVSICQNKRGASFLSLEGRQGVRKHASTAQITFRANLWRAAASHCQNRGEIRGTLNDFSFTLERPGPSVASALGTLRHTELKLITG